MNATARDFNSQPADTNGLEDIFETEISLSQGEILNQSRETVAEKNETAVRPFESLTVQEAVKRLRMPRSTVYRHVRSGKYITTQGQDGKLRILLRQDEIPNETAEIPNETAEIPSETVGIPNETAEILSETVEILQESNTGTVDVDGLLSKLEGATYRIGYLEAQLEVERQKVKLLTDSQHKPSAWSKFMSWFMGGP